MSCPSGCAAGLCLPPCLAGATRCNGSTLEVCDSSGAAWSFSQACTNGCSQAMCVGSALDVTVPMSIAGGTLVVGALRVRAGAALTVTSGVLRLHASSIVVEAGATLLVLPTGANPLGKGATAMGSCSGGLLMGGGGGSSGTAGLVGGCGTATPPYGVATDVDALESGAGGAGSNGAAGGLGGGIIELVASTITIQGTVSANGAQGAAGSAGASGGGGGAGGTIVLAGDTLNVTGLLSAAGGSGGPASGAAWAGGAGGQGRLKLLWGKTKNFSGTFTGVRTDSVIPPLVITSTSHPDPALTYNDGFSEAWFSWERPSAFVAGTYRAFNGLFSTVPGPVSGVLTFEERVQLPRASVSVGNTYLHLASADQSFFPGTVEQRFPLRVNGTPPTLASSTHPSSALWYAADTVFFSWTYPVPDASVRAVRYEFDRFGDTRPTPSSPSVTTKALIRPSVPPGVWALHLVAEDQRGVFTQATAHLVVRVGADPGVGTILGVVSSAASGPISGATVRVNRGLLASTTTDSSGAFTFPLSIPAGTWELEVSKSGLQTTTQQVTVTAAATTNVTFTLP